MIFAVSHCPPEKAALQDKCALLAMTIPFAMYAWAVWHFSINVPYWDDFSVILDPLSRLFTAQGASAKLAILSAPNAGHLPLLTRLVSALQVWIGGEVNFRQSVMMANVGWLATVLVLLVYFRRHLLLPWLALLPVPLLLLSITHWEAMDFTTPAWQMYWGATLLPVLCLRAAVRGQWWFTAVFFAFALFVASGALALYPLLLLFGLIRRQWRGVAAFAIAGSWALGLFFYCNPPLQQMTDMPSASVVLRFVPAFMGNVVGTGSWYLEGLAWLHWPLGLLVIAAGVRCMRHQRDADFSILVFVYVLMLAGMAVYLRGSGYGYVVSRYAMLALLAVACLYCEQAREWSRSGVMGQRWIMVAVLLSAGVWAGSYVTCFRALEHNQSLRMAAAQRYLQGGELGKLLWSEEYGQAALKQAAAAGVFDPQIWSLQSAQLH